MGRSKFPGKPPKTVTRRRIKVLGQPEEASSDSANVAAAETENNVVVGDEQLSPLRETSSADGKKAHPPFHGFSIKDVKLTTSYVRSTKCDVTSEKPPIVADSLLPTCGNDETKNASSPGLPKNLSSSCSDIENLSEECKSSTVDKRVSSGGKSKEASEKCEKKGKDKKFSNVSSSLKSPVLKSVNNNILERNHRTRQLRNSTAKRLLRRAKSTSQTQNEREKCTPVVRKFVLPIRSAHSSRVIKPNKRFIEELEEISSSHGDNDDGSKQVKRVKLSAGKTPVKVLPKCESSNLASSKAKAKSTLPFLKITGKDGGKEKGKAKVKEKDKEIEKVKQEDHKNEQKEIEVDNEKEKEKEKENKKETRKDKENSKEKAKDKVKDKQKDKVTDPVCEEESVNSDFKDEMKVNTEEILKDIETGGDTDSSLSDVEQAEDDFSEWSGTKLNSGKAILRKARLKLHNQTVAGTEGPFSTVNAANSSNNGTSTSSSGTVKCGVCGAVRFYRFIKQARKFGINSCGSCRKFISKMIKRQACAKSTNTTLPVLLCHKSDGLCLVPPTARSQQWNLMRCVYKARCPACWLKMCLKCYNIPTALRFSLNALLPPLMREPPSISTLSMTQDDSASQFESQASKASSCKAAWPSEESLEKNLFKSAMNWNNVAQKVNYQGISGSLLRKLDKFDYPVLISPSKKRKKDNRIQVRKKMKNFVTSFTASSVDQMQRLAQSQQPQKITQILQLSRQRIDLKGPRVKHVCRSASVALGQPMATFPNAEVNEESSETSKNIPKFQKDVEKPGKKEEEPQKEKELKELHKSNQDSSNLTTISQPKRNKIQQSNTLIRTLPKPQVQLSHTISIDFWEQYDPEEVGAKGFALIGSEVFHIPACCLLCGSAGKEPMIHCQCCCEPYHAFCLDPSEWASCVQPNWCCPRCTICQTCHLRSGAKIACIRCRRSFHHSCLSKSGIAARLYSPERPFVCTSCIKCKSCGSEGVNVHVGNLPLCSMCFKLRQRGNYCPLCQRCYNENEFDSKMMECNECSCWVHARCENLSDERYQVLSYLPDSVEFTCRQCSPEPNSVWRNAIETELKSGFIAIIKALSKNRKTSVALKWSPRKECLCRPVSTIRKFEFVDEKSVNISEDFEEYNSEGSTSTRSENSSSTATECEDGPRRGLRRLRQKHQSGKAGLLKLKSFPENENTIEENSIAKENKECNCPEQQIVMKPSPTLISIKKKVNGNEYRSLSQFHKDMEFVFNRVENIGLIQIYRETLTQVFPWFDPQQTIMESIHENEYPTPTKETSPSKLDESFLEVWKEEILKVPKVIASKTGNHYANITMEDARSCCLCKGLSDGQEAKEGRLLYCGQNEWIHTNCALWSNEVYEEIDGSLQNVHNAISRGRLIRCTECGKKGASIGCCAKNCGNTFHFLCARTVSLAFNDDKTIFCASHVSKCSEKMPHKESDFAVRRPVYVERDRKKKKCVEPKKVKVMIGALSIESLGNIIPQFSDNTDKLIPSGFECSRFFWSTINPTKIVRYHIRTYIQVYSPDSISDLENNVTIDHSKERKLQEEISNRYLSAKQTLEALVDSVCSKEVEENNTDLLPPELKEAIFEDLPHDLLDGISMQDIFPKISYEDFSAMDLKSEDLLKDDILPNEVDEMAKNQRDSAELCVSVQDLVDDFFNSKSQKVSGRDLKRPKSEVVSSNSNQRHQRSCSLTWSCKVDTSMKRRKLPDESSSKEHKRLLWHARQQSRILQVDGAADNSSLSECSSPEYSIEEKIDGFYSRVSLSMPQLDGAFDESSCDFKDMNSKNPVTWTIHATSISEKPEFESNMMVTENSDGISVKIPQLDGAGDISSDDETGSQINESPVTCKRCQCTYRTLDSYDRHLSSCDVVTTSDSDSDATSHESRFSPVQYVATSPSEGEIVNPDFQEVLVTSPLEASVPSPRTGLQLEPVTQAMVTPQIHAHSTVETVHQTVLTSNDVIVQTQYTRTTTTLPNSTVLPDRAVQITEVTDPSLPQANAPSPPESQKSNVNAATAIQAVVNNPSVNKSNEAFSPPKVTKAKVTKVTKPRSKVIKSKQANIPANVNGRFQTMQAPLILQQTQRQTPPTVILQQVAPQNLMSAYVESLQQQAGHNLQYIISGQDTGFKPQYITTNSLVPGAYIQASSDNILALQNGGISVLPGTAVQLAQPQPTMLGTIIQQQPGAIQCGVISSEQLVFNSTPTLEMFADSTGANLGLYSVSSQPMYYGLETIVSNTVMSSSQFVAGAVPQVLASSYQTTTQVFQASKLVEPMVDVQGVPTMQNSVPVQSVPGISGGYVVVNQPQQLNEASVAPANQINPVNQITQMNPATQMNQVNPVHQINHVNSVSQMNQINPVNQMNQINSMSQINQVNPVNQINQVNPMSQMTQVNPLHQMNQMNQVNPLNSLNTGNVMNSLNSISASNPVNPVLPMNSMNSMNSMNQVNQVNPVNPMNSVNVVNPVNSLYSMNSMNHVNAVNPINSAHPMNSMNPIVNQVNPLNSVNSSMNSVNPMNSANHANSGNSLSCMTSIDMNSATPIIDDVGSLINAEIRHGEADSLLMKTSESMQMLPTSIPRVAVKPSPSVQHTTGNPEAMWKAVEPMSEQPLRPYFDSKHVSENTSMLKSRISPLPNHCIAQQQNPSKLDSNSVNHCYNSVMHSNNGNGSLINSMNLQHSIQNKSICQNSMQIKTTSNRPMNRVLPMQAVTPKQETIKVTQKPEHKLLIEEPTKPEYKPAEPEATPYESIEKEITKNSEIKGDLDISVMKAQLPFITRSLPEIEEDIVTKDVNDFRKKHETEKPRNDTKRSKEKEKEKEREKDREREREREKEIPQNASLKIVLQKQVQDGSYKISHNISTKKSTPQITSIEVLPPQKKKSTVSPSSIQLLPLKSFVLKTTNKTDNVTNLTKTRSPPIAVKKPRMLTKNMSSISKKNPSPQQSPKKMSGPSLVYEIKSQDGFTHTASSMTEVWDTVYRAVQSSRKAHNLPPLSHNPLTENLGLDNNATIYLVEQLPGVNRCSKYKPKFHNLPPPTSEEVECDLPKECLTGAARAESFRGRKVHDMFSWLASRHRQQPRMVSVSEMETRRTSSTNLPMAMRFRMLKETSKESVGVYHSHIHGRGLFCLRDIEAGEMVIEYAGEVIRASLTDKREKYYDSKHIGCYMFKVDDHVVVDATMKGNAARFINHSCEPNCYSRVVDILGKKHILIFALRRIIQGEELTYDYKFPFEDIKIPCTCGSRRCRKYLN